MGGRRGRNPCRARTAGHRAGRYRRGRGHRGGRRPRAGPVGCGPHRGRPGAPVHRSGPGRTGSRTPARPAAAHTRSSRPWPSAPATRSPWTSWPGPCSARTPPPSSPRRASDRTWQRFLAAVVAALGHLRAVAGRAALTVEAHLWVRELTRIDRAADSTAQFRWGDDGPPVAGSDGGDIAELRPSFPAVFCRECGRSGWGVGLAAVGHDLAGTDATIRRDHVRREGRFRAAAVRGPGGRRGVARVDGSTGWPGSRSARGSC